MGFSGVTPGFRRGLGAERLASWEAPGMSSIIKLSDSNEYDNLSENM